MEKNIETQHSSIGRRSFLKSAGRQASLRHPILIGTHGFARSATRNGSHQTEFD